MPQKKKRVVKKPLKLSNANKQKNIKVYKDIIAILFVCIGIFMIVSIWFSAGGIIGNGLTFVCKGLFGDVAYLIPLLLVGIAAQLIVTKPEKMRYKLTLDFLAFIELTVLKHYMYRVSNVAIPNGVNGLFEYGTVGVGGGFVGGVITEPIMTLFGSVGAFIFFLAVLLVLIVLMFEISIISISKQMFIDTKKSLKSLIASINQYDKKDDELLKLPLPKNNKVKEIPFLEAYRWDKQHEIVIHDPLSDMERERENLRSTELKEEPSIAVEEKLRKEEIVEIVKEIEESKQVKKKLEYIYPSPDLLHEGSVTTTGASVEQLKANAQKLVDILSSFGIEVRVTNITRGSSITRYEVLPADGIKVNKILSLDQDIALRLPANNVRIEVLAGSIAIEISNDSVSSVYLRSIIEKDEFTKHPSKLAIALGKDINGNTVVVDIAKTPHLLIAGATGSGKSVCINTIITSIIYKASPSEVKLVLVDPKVVELGVYDGIPHLLVPIVTDPRKAAGAMCWAVQEMEDRYKAFAARGARDLAGYNKKLEESGEGEKLPQIVIIIDEFADLMMVAPGEVQDYICRLAQKARAAGMHLVLATQRPSVDVITGIIKANIPSRLSFAVSSQVDSRTILDTGGAEKLMGRGDMLLMLANASKLTRVQGAFVSYGDVEDIVKFVKNQHQDVEYNIDVQSTIESSSRDGKSNANSNDDGDADAFFDDAAEIAFELGQISASMLQRKLKVGYARAGRLIDLLEVKRIISPYDGSNKPRTVIMSRGEFLEMKSHVD